MSWTQQATTNAMPPFGLYVMEVTEVGDPEMSDNTNGEYEAKEQVKFTFKILKVIHSDDDEAEEFIGETTYGWANFTFGPKAKLRAWAQALLGREIEDGESVSGEMLIGKRATVTIGPTQTGRRKVATLMPYSGNKKKSSASQKSNLPPASDPEGFEDDDSEDEF